MKTRLLLSVSLTLLLAPSSFGQSLFGTNTNDPVAHFRSVYEMSIVRKLLKLEADLNSDGRVDVLLGHIDQDPDTNQLTPDDEIGWWLYVAQAGGGYVLAGEKSDEGTVTDSVPSFKKNQYKIGMIPEIGRYSLLHLSCGRGGQAQCQLKAIVIEGDAFKEIPIGQSVSSEENYDQLAQRFSQNPTPPVQEFDP